MGLVPSAPSRPLSRLHPRRALLACVPRCPAKERGLRAPIGAPTVQGRSWDVGAMSDRYSPYSLVPSHPLFVWTFSSRQGLTREGDVQTRGESTRTGRIGLCVRGETEAIPSDAH